MANTIFTLIRHGQVAGAPALYGHTDIALSEEGQTNFRNTLEHIHSQQPIDKLISSPLKRCVYISQQFADDYAIPFQTQADFMEMYFGAWDGIPFDHLSDNWEEVEKFFASPYFQHPPQGETLALFANRITHAWNLLISQPNHGHSVICCHGGVIRIIIAHILQMDWKNANLFTQLHIDYASHTRIEIGNDDKATATIKWIGAA